MRRFSVGDKNKRPKTKNGENLEIYLPQYVVRKKTQTEKKCRITDPVRKYGNSHKCQIRKHNSSSSGNFLIQ